MWNQRPSQCALVTVLASFAVVLQGHTAKAVSVEQHQQKQRRDGIGAKLMRKHRTLARTHSPQRATIVVESSGVEVMVDTTLAPLLSETILVTAMPTLTNTLLASPPPQVVAIPAAMPGQPPLGATPGQQPAVEVVPSAPGVMPRGGPQAVAQVVPAGSATATTTMASNSTSVNVVATSMVHWVTFLIVASGMGLAMLVSAALYYRHRNGPAATRPHTTPDVQARRSFRKSRSIPARKSESDVGADTTDFNPPGSQGPSHISSAHPAIPPLPARGSYKDRVRERSKSKLSAQSTDSRTSSPRPQGGTTPEAASTSKGDGVPTGDVASF